MKKKFIRLSAFLVATLILLTACTPTKPSETEIIRIDKISQEIIRTDKTFKEISYTRPDVTAINEKIATVLKNAQENKKEKDTLLLYDDILEDIVIFEAMQSIASVRNDIDLNDEYYEEEVNFLKDEYTKLDNKMNEITKAILESDFGDTATKRWGKDFVERYEKNSKLNSVEIEELTRQETELVNEYKKVSAKEFTAEYNGETVTINDIDFSAEDAINPYMEIYVKRNKELGEIYRELVTIRVEIAKTLGYDSYTDYSYECYGRDYTKEDAIKLGEEVKMELVDLTGYLRAIYANDIAFAQNNNTAVLSDGITLLQEVLKAEYPEKMSEALDYMLEHEMYDYTGEQSKMSSAYVASVNFPVNAPFMFVNSSAYNDPSTVIHEFGHYYNFFLMGKSIWGDTNSLDTAEIHSQGLELLMHDNYEKLYGENAETMKISNIIDILYSIMSGCAEDEFQQKVFENPTMSLEEMNLLHANVSQKYLGYPVLYEWVDIHHHYEVPFYYISYATSAISALEIWELASKNKADTLKKYEVLAQYTLNVPYLEALKSAGLSNPFNSDVVEKISDAIIEILPDEDEAKLDNAA